MYPITSCTPQLLPHSCSSAPLHCVLTSLSCMQPPQVLGKHKVLSAPLVMEVGLEDMEVRSQMRGHTLDWLHD